ncbi:conserved Plasmodium protein, unknown function [Plasmodium berghei]|uniref:Uncharacterized protein n=2 Tax=Plasmodium berghei TaxID=5821 RepID=A0A509AQT7_PLABA|nr:conserved Plasmodium protein, unknown function [Plasmodium berghei ANKA]CXJ22678.1 conserved Plasmodium protein, unknown function [Plasmodium berghei]SCM26674.1 conserved Plasmodium protein, unknown function [Plasmodium berghei]SCN28579.1 conserved Plasmodium protein, unknown function [Plasmodium berghei]SCO62767.1 conserved Plasmodium protein, unknown function [Plasmodium berghei]SCO64327.1 conserved Plasmodium protein, unknown function [Plasmodium berghei]|eukprot:XP_034424223.1 conserved Plasmodium protein, unknown function [Plasmodium berghei ANKA]
MLINNENKIKYLKDILYREKSKKIYKNIYYTNNNKYRFKNIGYSKNIYYNNTYKERIVFLYQNKTLIQIIGTIKSEKSIFLQDYKQNELYKNIEHNQYNDICQKEINNGQQHILKNKQNWNKTNKCVTKINKLCNNNFKSEIKVTKDVMNNEKIYNSVNLKKTGEENILNKPENLNKLTKYIKHKKENKNMIIINKYIERYEQNENKKNKLIIKYELKSLNNIMLILKKCQEYNYINYTLFEDIINELILYIKEKYKTIDLKKLIEISNNFIKFKYYNENYNNYLFMFLNTRQTITNTDLIHILYIIKQNENKINNLSALLIYRINFIIIHRLYSFSLNNLYNILNFYIKLNKYICIFKERKNGTYKKGQTIYNTLLNHEKKKIYEKKCVQSSGNFEYFYQIGNDTIDNSKYKKTITKKNSINFIFRLINLLNNQKINVDQLFRVINIPDCVNEPFYIYITNKISDFYLKKIKSEYVIYNRNERKRLYIIRNQLLQKEESQTCESEQIYHSINKNGKNYANPKVDNNIIIKSKLTQLSLIKKVKKNKINSRMFIPLLRLHNTNNNTYNNKLFDFFYYTYKHMNINFNPKGLMITFNIFSKMWKNINTDVLYMITNLIEQKINYFNHENIINILDSYSNISNEKIKKNNLNFIIRFLFNNNNIIYLNDTQIQILLNFVIKKKIYINYDAIYYITNFILNHKPYYKNLKNVYLYLFYHFHFNQINSQFLNFLYLFIVANKTCVENFEDLNKLISSTLVISKNIKYCNKINKIINKSVLTNLKSINSSIRSTFFLNNLKDIVNFIFYLNKSISSNVYVGHSIVLNKYGTLPKVCKIYEKKKKWDNRKKNNKNKIRLYFSQNDFNEKYLITTSFNVKILVYIKNIFFNFLNQQRHNIINNGILYFLLKGITNLYELQKKINIHTNNKYTYFYISQQGICKKSKIINNYILRIIHDINTKILYFLSQISYKIYFLNSVMIKNGYIFEQIDKQNNVLYYIQNYINQEKQNVENILRYCFFSTFLSSYKINEISLPIFSVNFENNNKSEQIEKRNEIDKLEYELMKKILSGMKIKTEEIKKENLFSIIYNEKKRKKISSKKVIKNMILSYKYSEYNYLKKYEYKKNVYMNKILKNIDKKALRRKINKIDNELKLNSDFKNVNKYNKMFIFKFYKNKIKPTKNKLILRNNIKTIRHIESNQIIELLISILTLSIRYILRNKFYKNVCNNNEYLKTCEKLIIYLLNYMMVLKKPQPINLNYHIYLKLDLCIKLLKYAFAKLYQNYAHILTYWKKIINKNLSNEKTFRNYFEYVKSEEINSCENLSIHNLQNINLNKNNVETLYNDNHYIVNNHIDNNKINLNKDNFFNLLNYPCISQTKYKYKLRNNTNYTFENNFFFKQASSYKNITHHNIYEYYRHLQNSSDKLYKFFINLKGKLTKKKRKKKKYTFVNSKCRKKNNNFKFVLPFNCLNIINAEKIYLFHNHLIKVDIKKNKQTSTVNTFIFFLYSSFNLNNVVKTSPQFFQIKNQSNQTFLQRDYFLFLFLARIILDQRYDRYELISIYSDTVNSSHQKKRLYSHLLGKLYT